MILLHSIHDTFTFFFHSLSMHGNRQPVSNERTSPATRLSPTCDTICVTRIVWPPMRFPYTTSVRTRSPITQMEVGGKQIAFNKSKVPPGFLKMLRAGEMGNRIDDQEVKRKWTITFSLWSKTRTPFKKINMTKTVIFSSILLPVLFLFLLLPQTSSCWIST